MTHSWSIGEKRMANELDDLFKQYALKAEEEKNNKKGSFTRDLENIKWTGLETGVPKVIRFVGEPFDSKLSDTTGRTVTIARVIGDDGKKFRLIRPSFRDDPNYIINRIISKVKQARWVDKGNGQKEKVVPVQQNFPEIYNIIEKNGLASTDIKAKYDKGWNGKEVLILNVIDREQMDWHRENKHTMLLAKSVNVDDNGNEWVDEGISAFAASEQIRTLWKRYGSWEKYDVAITRTSTMNQPYVIENATRTPEVVDDVEKEKLISELDELTDEEKSWTRYDLTKLFRVTTNTKIYNRLKGTIARIDAALGTHFLSELENEVAKEKVLFEEMYGTENMEVTDSMIVPESTATVSTYAESNSVASDVSTVANETVSQPTATTRSRIPAPTDKAFWKMLPYGNTLDAELRNHITSVKKDKDGNYLIDWDESQSDSLASCPVCGAIAPVECKICPACGISFEG